jgi:hypothetical protein
MQKILQMQMILLVRRILLMQDNVAVLDSLLQLCRRRIR